MARNLAPSKRPAPTRSREGEEVLDLNGYVPFLLNALSNAWQRRTSADYRHHFGLGITEWRVLSMVNIEPGITQNGICRVIRMDKSAASRALSTLEGRGLLRFEAERGDPRKRRWWLSEEGQELHRRILDIALGHEGILTSEIPPDELRVFLSILKRMLQNIDPD
ncbi:MarR family transcriptional regulator [Mesobaculum littorinae]|uniref:MarR family transcriptional regulator n=2 Tax=Mesobaculum littorinae TaxID=2486419 RepID=A0A438AKJ5_9RHOB|nr:MarR family transcriptional regulator [Mesobaculum littorinae]